MKVSGAQAALKRAAAQGTGDKRGELILRRQWGERVFQKNQSTCRTPAKGVGRRSVNRVGEVNRGGARIEDTVAAAQCQAPRSKRRVGKAYSWADVIWVPTSRLRSSGKVSVMTTRIDSTSVFLKPFAVTLMRYIPGGRSGTA